MLLVHWGAQYIYQSSDSKPKWYYQYLSFRRYVRTHPIYLPIVIQSAFSLVERQRIPTSPEARLSTHGALRNLQLQHVPNQPRSY